MKQVSLRELDSLDYSGKEALNSIATNLTFVGRHMNKFILTSCVASEGKSSLCMQLMLNLAQRGNSVVMVDADLRASFLMSRLKFEQGGVIQGLEHGGSHAGAVDHAGTHDGDLRNVVTDLQTLKAQGLLPLLQQPSQVVNRHREFLGNLGGRETAHALQHLVAVLSLGF